MAREERRVYSALGLPMPNLPGWSSTVESNHRPSACHADDLPLIESRMVRAKGVEPLSSVYQTDVLPLDDARMLAPRIWSFQIGRRASLAA